jgi:hypothetical protein
MKKVQMTGCNFSYKGLTELTRKMTDQVLHTLSQISGNVIKHSSHNKEFFIIYFEKAYETNFSLFIMKEFIN